MNARVKKKLNKRNGFKSYKKWIDELLTIHEELTSASCLLNNKIKSFKEEQL